jgi:3-methyladenine DNA glycosylase AlkD
MKGRPRPAARAPTAREVLGELEALGDPADAAGAQRYFKTGPGEYGAGDRFLGIRAAPLRALARKHTTLGVRGCRALLRSHWHEARLLALLILGRAYQSGNQQTRNTIYGLYLDNTDRINNWDLVDCSAPHIVGRHVEKRSRAILTRLARSESLWERRIAILATQHLIRQGDFADTFRVADVLLEDPHDLIHKAVGWMLREVGNRERAAEEAFLRPRYRRMPRTMLRYAIEKFPEPLRKRYLRGEV